MPPEFWVLVLLGSRTTDLFGAGFCCVVSELAFLLLLSIRLHPDGSFRLNSRWKSSRMAVDNDHCSQKYHKVCKRKGKSKKKVHTVRNKNNPRPVTSFPNKFDTDKRGGKVKSKQRAS